MPARSRLLRTAPLVSTRAWVWFTCAVVLSVVASPLSRSVGLSHALAHAGTVLVLGGLFAIWVRRTAQVQRRSDAWFTMGNDLFCEADMTGTFTRVNRAATEVLGWSVAELTSRPFISFVHPEDVARTTAATTGLVAKPSTMVNVENRFATKAGDWRWLLWSAHSDGDSIYCVAKDITDIKALEAQAGELLVKVDALARTDELTGLANRRAWNETAVRERARSVREASQLSVAMIDLDGLKEVNDTQGHGAGDDLLRTASERWLAELRDTDFLARIGGDEFGVLLPLCGHDMAREVATRLGSALPAGETASVGIATFDGSEAMVDVIARADRALYRAKRKSQDGIPVPHRLLSAAATPNE